VALGIAGRFGMLIEQWSAYDYAQVSPGVWEDHEEPYWAATKRLYFGVEPSATGGGGFEFYAGFGFAITFVPNSQYVDDTDSDYDPMRGDYPLEERRDAYTDFSFSGFTVGIRFRF
jgi:opacity protein-like surface antigen